MSVLCESGHYAETCVRGNVSLYLSISFILSDRGTLINVNEGRAAPIAENRCDRQR